MEKIQIRTYKIAVYCRFRRKHKARRRYMAIGYSCFPLLSVSDFRVQSVIRDQMHQHFLWVWRSMKNYAVKEKANALTKRDETLLKL